MNAASVDCCVVKAKDVSTFVSVASPNIGVSLTT